MLRTCHSETQEGQEMTPQCLMKNYQPKLTSVLRIASVMFATRGGLQGSERWRGSYQVIHMWIPGLNSVLSDCGCRTWRKWCGRIGKHLVLICLDSVRTNLGRPFLAPTSHHQPHVLHCVRREAGKDADPGGKNSPQQAGGPNQEGISSTKISLSSPLCQLTNNNNTNTTTTNNNNQHL